MTAKTSSCACGSDRVSEECCLPYIRGKRLPETALDLLRSRYTAFTLGDVDYVLSTHHPKTRGEVKREEIEAWSKNSRWLGLSVERVEAGQKDDEQGVIVFCARYHADGEDQEHWEQSLFEKHEGKWMFLDARDGAKPDPIRREHPKVGRNDPCSCGSGKKHEKCCG